MSAEILILGCGYTGEAIARAAMANGARVVGAVRAAERAARLRAMGVEVQVAPQLSAGSVAALVSPEVHVVVAFPPDGATDALVAPSAASAAAVTYVSSTSVYGDAHGIVDDRTPLPGVPVPRAARLLDAESSWRAVGATILRCPAIYGRDRGIHRRILRGEHRIAGDGASFTSRIHVDDLARLILASRVAPGETFVVGDLEPATQLEIGSWIAAEYDVPLPPRVPLAEVPETLRADRRIDGSRALATLGVTLRYPSFRDGMKREA